MKILALQFDAQDYSFDLKWHQKGEGHQGGNSFLLFIFVR